MSGTLDMKSRSSLLLWLECGLISFLKNLLVPKAMMTYLISQRFRFQKRFFVNGFTSKEHNIGQWSQLTKLKKPAMIGMGHRS